MIKRKPVPVNYKYMILFPIEGTYALTINRLMDDVHAITGKKPPYEKLIPHVTFHRPIKEISEEKILRITQSVALRMRSTRIKVNAFDHFGKEYVVLPVHATKTLASIWTGIHDILSQVPEYEHGPFDHDNTLHITIGDELSGVFDASWQRIKDIDIPEAITVPVKKIELWRKADGEGACWERVIDIPLSD